MPDPLDKHYISAQALLEDSFRLGLMILESGFRPTFMVGIWRGGTPVGIAVQELLETFGNRCDHYAIRTASYVGIGQRDREVRVHGMEYLIDHANAEDTLLIVDDVFDTGLSIRAVIEHLHRYARRNAPAEIRIATPWFKPGNNRTELEPDYYVHRTDRWLVFPHELNGLGRDELLANKPGLRALFEEYGV